MAIIVILGIVFMAFVVSKIEGKRKKDYIENTDKQIGETAKWWYNRH